MFLTFIFECLVVLGIYEQIKRLEIINLQIQAT